MQSVLIKYCFICNHAIPITLLTYLVCLRTRWQWLRGRLPSMRMGARAWLLLLLLGGAVPARAVMLC